MERDTAKQVSLSHQLVFCATDHAGKHMGRSGTRWQWGGVMTSWAPPGGSREATPVAYCEGRVCGGHMASQDGYTVLVKAAHGGHTDTVALLLDRGADLEAKGRVRSASVCLCAAGRAGRHGRAGNGGGGDFSSGCRAPVAVRRVGRGAIVRRGAVTCGPATAQGGSTGLVLAASGGHTDTVELLLGRGADLEAKDSVRSASM